MIKYTYEKNLFILIILLIILGIFIFIKNDKYTGFYYPDANNLLNDIQSEENFKSLEMCKAWIDEQISKYNPNGLGYDYECGKNCNLSSGKPYVCEETLE